MVEELVEELRQIIREEMGKSVGQGVEDDLLTESELAKILKCQRQTLSVWRSRGKGPSYLKLNGAVRYRRGKTMKWLEKNTVKTH